MRRADLGGPLDQSPPDPTPLVVGMHGGVQDEGVIAAVPGELDEADQPAAVVGTDVGQAAVDRRGRVGGLLAPGGLEKRRRLLIGDDGVDDQDDARSPVPPDPERRFRLDRRWLPYGRFRHP